MLTKWRSERDSNSRTAKPPNDLANRPLQPLEYHSIINMKFTKKASAKPKL